MATPAQIAANRQNAQRSSGPKTVNGKCACVEGDQKESMMAPRDHSAPTKTWGLGAAPTDSSPDLRSDVARLSALIEQEWDRLIAGEPAVSANRALDLLTAAEASLSAGAYTTAQKRWARLSAILRQGTDIANTEDRLLHLIEGKRKLVDAYVKTSQTYTQDEVRAMFGKLAMAVRRRVSDPAVRRQILKDYKAAAAGLDMPSDPAGTNGSPAAKGQEQAWSAASRLEYELDSSPAGNTRKRGTNHDDISSEDCSQPKKRNTFKRT